MKQRENRNLHKFVLLYANHLKHRLCFNKEYYAIKSNRWQYKRITHKKKTFKVGLQIWKP